MKISKCRSLCIAALTGCALFVMSSSASAQLVAKGMPDNRAGARVTPELKVATGQMTHSGQYRTGVRFTRFRQAILWTWLRHPTYPVQAMWVWFAFD
jgi:hypothetical protein